MYGGVGIGLGNTRSLILPYTNSNEYGVGSVVSLHSIFSATVTSEIVPVVGTDDGCGVPVGVGVGVGVISQLKPYIPVFLSYNLVLLLLRPIMQ